MWTKLRALEHRHLIVAAMVLSVSASGAPAREQRAAFAPTPNGPVYAGIPGALPPQFHYVYGDTYRGWPINPTHSAASGAGLVPRPPRQGRHGSLGISLRHRHQRRRRPSGTGRTAASLPPRLRGRVGHGRRLREQRCSSMSRPPRRDRTLRLLARLANRPRRTTCACRTADRLVMPRRLARAPLRVAALPRPPVWVNPLHRGSPLSPYTDTAPPTVNALTLQHAPAHPLAPDEFARPGGHLQPTGAEQPARTRRVAREHRRPTVVPRFPQPQPSLADGLHALPGLGADPRRSNRTRGAEPGQLPRRPDAADRLHRPLRTRNRRRRQHAGMRRPTPEAPTAQAPTGSDRSHDSARNTGTPTRRETAPTRSPSPPKISRATEQSRASSSSSRTRGERHETLAPARLNAKERPSRQVRFEERSRQCSDGKNGGGRSVSMHSDHCQAGHDRQSQPEGAATACKHDDGGCCDDRELLRGRSGRDGGTPRAQPANRSRR